jgi:CPA2 family monovalent cation:H+ antiporter-2
VVPIFILVGVLAGGSSANLIPLAAMALAKATAAIVLIYLLGRRVIRPLFRSFAGQHQPDVFMALTLLASLGIAAITAAAGLSMALGAFLAGLLLAETELRHEVEVTIEPFKGLLMGLFFMSVGMQIDVREIMRSPVWIPLSVAGLFLIKGWVVALIFRAGGLRWGRAIEGGLLLGQGGEFAFIVIGQAVAGRLLEPAVGQFMMLVVSLSMFVTPPVARVARALGKWRRHGARLDEQEPALPEPAGERVIIAGFGRVGQLLGEILASQGISYIALESDARLVTHLNPQGFPIYFGNVARVELLDKLHARHATAIVLTMDHPASALHAVKAIRRAYPLVPLFARSRDEKHAVALRQAGATLVIPETLESGLQLSAFVLETLGIAESAAARIIELERERRIGGLQ